MKLIIINLIISLSLSQELCTKLSVPCHLPPPCKDVSYKLNQRLISPDKYNGDHTKYDFIVDGEKQFFGKDLVLKLDSKKEGASAYSTRYVHYGVVSATIKIPLGVEVKGGFMLLSDNKREEISFKWDGGKPGETSTNYRITKHFDHASVSHLDPVNLDFVTYTIDWNEERIEWKVNDELVRSLPASDPNYPTKPARIYLGLWNTDIKYKLKEKGKRPKKRQSQLYLQISNLNVQCTGDPQVTEEEFIPLLPKPQSYDDDLDNGQFYLPPSLAVTLLLISILLIN